MLLLIACEENTASENVEPPVRGLKTLLIEEVEETVVRLAFSSLLTLFFVPGGYFMLFGGFSKAKSSSD